MALNNTYERKVRANPTALNPNQHYVQEYDADAELAKGLTALTTKAIDIYAKLDYEAAERDTQEELNKRQTEQKDALRRANLIEEPRAREDFYNKEMEKINKKYGKSIDDRFAADYNRQVAQDDDVAKLDLYFNRDKDLQSENKKRAAAYRDKMAEQAAGADAAYSAVLDTRVKADLDNQLKNGAISRFEYTQAWDDYTKKKQLNNLNHRLIVDPEGLDADLAQNTYGMNQKDLDSWRTKTNNALKNRKMEADLKAEMMISQNTEQAINFINNAKMPPQNLLNTLPEKVQKGLQEKYNYALQGEDVPTDVNVYDHLQTMLTQDPARFKRANLYEYIGDLSEKDFKTFQALQSSVVTTKGGKSSADPTIKRAQDLMALAYAKAGIKKDDAEGKYHFNSAYEAEVSDFISEHKRKPTRQEDEAIINRLVKETQLQSKHWFTYASDKQTWNLNPEDYTKAYVPLKDIKQGTRDNITRFLAGQNIDLGSLTANERNEWIEKVAGTLSLPRYMQSQAMSERLMELRTYLSNKR